MFRSKSSRVDEIQQELAWGISQEGKPLTLGFKLPREITVTRASVLQGKARGLTKKKGMIIDLLCDGDRKLFWPCAHRLINGVTRSGKTVHLYWGMYVCSQVLGRYAEMCLVDPTGIVGRAFANAVYPVSGAFVNDPQQWVRVLEGVHSEMVSRIDSLASSGADKWEEFGEKRKKLILVLEEYAFQQEAMNLLDKRLAKRYQALLFNILSNGLKAGVEVWISTQSSLTTCLPSALRDSFSERVILKSQPSTVRALAEATDEQIALLQSCPPGIGLYLSPSQENVSGELMRCRHLPYKDLRELLREGHYHKGQCQSRGRGP